MFVFLQISAVHPLVQCSRLQVLCSHMFECVQISTVPFLMQDVFAKTKDVYAKTNVFWVVLKCTRCAIGIARHGECQCAIRFGSR